ncbi:MAG TPA: acetyl-CoA carboxylase biotin carboxyl carrier protein [bacterium]|nr:acetyl-CoA carboxylase biotin carboxyl carrier protein [bacterium]
MTDRIDFDQVREVVRIATESDVAELEIETPSLKVRVRKAGVGPVHVQIPVSGAAGHHNPVHVPPGYTPPGSAVLPGATALGGDHLVPAVAPMVGTFYRAASPDAAPFVKEGDLVDEGQVICIIEAMKLFNEIQAEVPGRIAKVLVENATPVEYGQPLFLLDTSAARS